MAIENTYLLGKNITLGCGFDLQAKAPLDSRQTVPAFAGLQALIDGNAAYEGMIVYDEETKKTYQAQLVDDVLAFREFGINEAELKDLIASETTAAMEFKGVAAALPENPSKGDMYKVTVTFKVGEEDAKVGDSIVYDGTQWFIIPSGDDIEDTWRPVTGVDNDSALTFAAGDKLEKTVAADGTITYKHEAIDAPEDMTSEDDERTRTYITQLITDNHGHIIGFKTATENVEDTNTEYTFEGQSDEATSVYFQVTSNEEGASAEVIYLDAYSKNEADGKFVAKETGKSLISDDEIARLADVDNYDDEEVRGLIDDSAKAIEDLEAYVGTIPNVPDADGNNKYADLDVIGYINKKSQETLAAAQGGSSETAASVKGQLDDYIGENNARVKAVEDDIAAIKDADNGILKQAKDYSDGLASNYDEAGAAAGVQTALEAEIAKKVDADAYATDKATFAIAETVNAALDLKANAADVVANDTFESFKTANTAAIGEARTGAVADVEAKGYAVASDVEATYATKTELGNIDKKFENYVTSASYATDKAAIDKAIEDESKARSDADAGFETRIAALEGNFGDGEGTVEAQIAAAVKVEEDARKEAVKGVQDEVAAVDAKFADYTKTADLPTDLGDFTNNAGYAKTVDVNTELDKKADKTQVATDIENAIAPLATTEALNGVKATAEAATTVEEVDAQIDAKITALNLATTYEPIGAETRAKAYADGLITEANLDQYTTEQEVKNIVDGVIKTATDKETLDSLVELVEYIDTHSGDAINMATAIGVLEGKVEVIEKKPAYDITATQVSNWDNEVGAKALAGTKLDASTFTEYSNAHASDYTNKQIDDAIDADVKAAIDAEVIRANGAYDAKGAAADAQAAAEATAAGALATARTEITTEIGTAISSEVSRADGKYEEKGVAQGIVDALKLADTYEPIGAEGRAIAAAKTETENQVKALAEGQVATNTDDIATLFGMFQWGEF